MSTKDKSRPDNLNSEITAAAKPMVFVTAATLAASLLTSLLLGLPMVLPGSDAYSFINFHYTLPILTIVGWSILSRMSPNRHYTKLFLAAFLCYAVIMICHFNVKLWMAHINPVNFDAFYWSTDEALRPLVDFSFAARAALTSLFGEIDRVYLVAFVLMFYMSFAVQARRDIEIFKRIALSAFLVQALGSFSYAIAPAVGPFIYEGGINAVATAQQQHMMEVYQQHTAAGAEWFAVSAKEYLLTGLAAMPSLHTAASLVFLIYAWRSERWLLPIYIPLFVFILIEAVATRWHYVIDLPAGALLALICVAISDRIYGARRESGDTPMVEAAVQ